MVSPPTEIDLRQCALAIAVTIDLDVAPADDGLVLQGVPDVAVSWRDCRRALGGRDPAAVDGRARLAWWLLRRRWVADHTYDDLAERARPLGLPVDHVLHPGLDWVRRRVLGDELDMGFGFVGLQPGHPDRVIVVPQTVLEAADLDPGPWGVRSEAYLEEMGGLAAQRFFRDRTAVLKPMGDCDVVTLLGSRTFRTALVSGPAAGMRPAIVPMRTRGWVDLSRIDPAFGPAAAAATAAEDRGFPRPLLITEHEVAMVVEGGRPESALSDRTAEDDWARPVLYR